MDSADLAKHFSVSHPFHPLYRQEFEVLDLRTAWGEERVYFHDAAGKLQRLPLQWTSLAPVDPFVAINAGRSHLRIQELLQLVQVVQRLDAACRARRGKEKARNVK